MQHERLCNELGIRCMQLPLSRGLNKDQWISPMTLGAVSVEEAVLDHFRSDGWDGYSGEGGLILNLIKAMSFPTLENRHRSTFIEALYAQNVSFNEDRFNCDWLLSNVKKSTRDQVRTNLETLFSREPYTIDFGAFRMSYQSSMLDYFPHLAKDMFLALFDALGQETICSIAAIFSKDPYTYRNGWPDITMWKQGEVKFLEVKAPRDRMQRSQKTLIKELLRPLNLDVTLVSVVESVVND